MTKRKSERIKKRLTCDLHAGGRRYTGIVLDFSSEGLFVRTSARLKLGDTVRVVLKVGGHPQGIEAEAQVARAKLVPAALRSSAGGGVGLRIGEPPEDYLRFVAGARPAGGAQAVSFSTGTTGR